MPYEITWHQEKRIIFERLYGDLDMEVATQAANMTDQHLKEGLAPVHLVISVSEMRSFPTNIAKVNSISTYLKNPNLGWVVLIGGNALTNFITSIISQVVKFKVCQRPGLEQAIEFLQLQDPTLKSEPAPSSSH